VYRRENVLYAYNGVSVSSMTVNRESLVSEMPGGGIDQALLLGLMDRMIKLAAVVGRGHKSGEAESERAIDLMGSN
jgi:hypothetical protein